MSNISEITSIMDRIYAQQVTVGKDAAFVIGFYEGLILNLIEDNEEAYAVVHKHLSKLSESSISEVMESA